MYINKRQNRQCDEIMSIQNKIIIYSVEYPNPDTQKWEVEKIPDLPFSDEEYKTFLKGYTPDWDCRYAPFQFVDWLYITRSGFWVKKFKYEKQNDGFYHVTQHFTTEKERGRNLLMEILCEGYFRPSLFEVAQRTGLLNV